MRHEKSSLVVTADYHIKISKDVNPFICSYTSGLLHFTKMLISKNEKDAAQVICNPSTGHYATLPKLSRYIEERRSSTFLGFDPIDKQFKVLSIIDLYSGEKEHHILTLGTENLRWRKIKCSLTHGCSFRGICINGVLYYLVEQCDHDTYEMSYVIVCFDVRSEKFKFVEANFCRNMTRGWPVDLILINYKGKLGGVNLQHDSGFILDLCVWVLEDVEKHEWSKYYYYVREEDKVDKFEQHLSLVGMTASGEIVLSIFASKPYCVYYFNPERNTLRKVEIQGFEEYLGVGYGVFAFVDYVEDLNVIGTKQLRPNPLHQGLRKMPKPKSRAPSVKKINKEPVFIKNKYELLANLE